MTGMYGLDVLTKLRGIDPAVRVIIATADIQKVDPRAGARGWRLRLRQQAAGGEKLRTVIAKVLEGADTWI